SDTVPPQIVAVTDNGVSYDAASFSQTLTQPVLVTVPLGSTHRKIQAVQTVTDNGSTCDSLLSGSTTHGNVVAGIIAGAPGDFGLTYTKSLSGAAAPPISGIPMDALARGSRIIMQDAGDSNQCTTVELIKQGGH